MSVRSHFERLSSSATVDDAVPASDAASEPSAPAFTEDAAETQTKTCKTMQAPPQSSGNATMDSMRACSQRTTGLAQHLLSPSSSSNTGTRDSAITDDNSKACEKEKGTEILRAKEEEKKNTEGRALKFSALQTKIQEVEKRAVETNKDRTPRKTSAEKNAPSTKTAVKNQGSEAASQESNSNTESEKSSSNEESDGASDCLSNMSEDFSMFEIAAAQDMPWITIEDRDAQIAGVIRDQLREHPLCPPCLQDPTSSWRDMQSGIQVPQLHCAFKGCLFTSPLRNDEDPLAQHVYEKHLSYGEGLTFQGSAPCWREIAASVEIKEAEVDETEKERVNVRDKTIAKQRRLLWYLRKRGGFDIASRFWNSKTQTHEYKNASLVERTLLDYYVEALRMREREKMPEVGYCMDRRTLQHLTHYCNDDHVHSLVCFVCAQIFTDCSGSRKNTKDANFE